MTIIPAGNVVNRPVWTLADRLRKSRESAGLEQDELASVAGISRATISAAENGRRSPSRATLAMWAMATGVSRSWLADGIDSDALDTVRMNALLALITAQRFEGSPGHQEAQAVLDAVSARENAVQEAGRWQASTAIAHPEVFAWCRAYRPDLADALEQAGDGETPPDGGGVSESRLSESNRRPFHYKGKGRVTVLPIRKDAA